MIRLVGIASHREKRSPMVERERATVGPDRLVGDRVRFSMSGKRHVTVLSAESWAIACKQAGHEGLTWTTRRANLLVSGVQFDPTCVGKRIHIGSVVLEITGECDPCPRMDAQAAGLTAALTPDWRAGVTCRIITSGDIALKMEVTIE